MKPIGLEYDVCQVRALEVLPVSLKQKVAIERWWELNHLFSPLQFRQHFSYIQQQILFHVIESTGSLWLFYKMTFTDKFILQRLQKKGLLPTFPCVPSGRMSFCAEAVGTSGCFSPALFLSHVQVSGFPFLGALANSFTSGRP